ncbi:MAG: RNA-binding protein [Candidatus Omnitrophica bacterium]|nr:RNA-binding protein [Candidatus Omnitrophota bacterium]
MDQVSKLYVGNLDFNTTEDELKSYFEQKGIETKTATIIKDKYSDRSKGFGFVEVSSEEILQKAIEALNGQELGGRKLTVSKAKPPRERSDGPGRSSGGPGGGSGERGRSGFGGGRRPRF